MTPPTHRSTADAAARRDDPPRSGRCGGAGSGGGCSPSPWSSSSASGVLGVYGVRTRETQATGGGYELTVTYTERHPARAGHAVGGRDPPPGRLRRRAGDRGRHRRPTSTPSTRTASTPTRPSRSATASARIWRFEPPAGDVMTVSFDARIEPGVQLTRVKGTVVGARPVRAPTWSPSTSGRWCCPDGDGAVEIIVRATCPLLLPVAGRPGHRQAGAVGDDRLRADPAGHHGRPHPAGRHPGGHVDHRRLPRRRHPRLLDPRVRLPVVEVPPDPARHRGRPGGRGPGRASRSTRCSSSSG